MQYGELMVQYANLRSTLHRIIEQDLGSAMNTASAQLISETRGARQMLAANAARFFDPLLQRCTPQSTSTPGPSTPKTGLP